MAYTLLQAVNSLLKRVKIVQGDAGALTSLTDSARQGFIDKAVKSWNDVIQELYTTTASPMPSEYKEDSIVLVSGTREYDLATDLEQLRWPLMDQTIGQRILEYPGGYEAMFAEQLQPAQYTGLPNFACINPANGKLRVDRTPGAAEDGRTYVYGYDKRINLSLATDTFPFSDTVTDALEKAAAEVWLRYEREKFDAGMFQTGMGQAARLLSKAEPRRRW